MGYGRILCRPADGLRHCGCLYLGAELGSGYEWWYNFYEFHKLAIDELEAFNYRDESVR